MSTKKLWQFLIIVLVSGCHSNSGHPFASGRWIDLSHSYDQNTPYWPTAEGFRLDTVFAGMTEGGYYYSAFQFSSAEHGGTHIDAPVHFSEGKKTVDEIPLENLTGFAVVIDVRDSVSQYIDYQVNQSDFERWESRHGAIPDGAIVLLRTGFEKFWPDRKQYLGTEQRGAAAVRLLHFPGLDPAAARWLTEFRSVSANGLDTPSIDYGRSSDFLTHRILFEKNIPAFENLANLGDLPPYGAYIVALPMKIRGGSGGPLRIAAFLPG